MCGRFAYWDSSSIQEAYHCNVDASINANYNACPSQHIPVIVASLQEESSQPTRILEVMRWGLIPDWANIDQHKGFINARAETITTKPSFKENFKLRRCVIPCIGYYEWDARKQPHFISNSNRQLCFAAIWDGSNTGIYPSTAILTIQASALSHIHHRCPLVLYDDHAISLWLNPTTPQEILLTLIQQANDEPLISHEVNKQVNNPRTNNPSLIEKSSEKSDGKNL